jgi:hypothetical protein
MKKEDLLNICNGLNAQLERITKFRDIRVKDILFE